MAPRAEGLPPPTGPCRPGEHAWPRLDQPCMHACAGLQPRLPGAAKPAGRSVSRLKICGVLCGDRPALCGGS
jgi:hypothetical protein